MKRTDSAAAAGRATKMLALLIARAAEAAFDRDFGQISLEALQETIRESAGGSDTVESRRAMPARMPLARLGVTTAEQLLGFANYLTDQGAISALAAVLSPNDPDELIQAAYNDVWDTVADRRLSEANRQLAEVLAPYPEVD